MTTKTDAKPRKWEEAYESATALLVEALEAGNADPTAWAKPWQSLARADRNPATGAVYKGGNAVACALTRWAQDWEQPAWSTYRGWQGLGRQVRKGEHGLWLVHWAWVPSKREKVVVNGVEKPKLVLVPNAFTVFNYAQTDVAEGAESPWEPTPLTALNVDERSPEADAAIAATGARISYVPGSDRAYYTPSADAITLPTFEDFKDAAGYYATALHELGHWTGHQSRLNRDFSGRFGDEAYAVEELVAELSSVFSMARLGLSPEGPRVDHAHYVAHWVKVLRSDAKALWQVAGRAQKATEFVFGDTSTPAAADDAAPGAEAPAEPELVAA